MCGRYAMGIRASFIRHQLQAHNMPVSDFPDDEDVRQSYNFAPGYNGLVYRADVPDYGAGSRNPRVGSLESTGEGADDMVGATEEPKETRYKLQSMKWGLVPFWTKRNPDYQTVLKTINARDDSLMENRGMWNTMKQGKRCIVIAQGFYEWLKKNGGKEKVPHYVKRKDGQLMCFAGLWDCVQYEGPEQKLYTYTIITTDSNKHLKFLHDRMPVILENGSVGLHAWLDPKRSEWSRELQSLLKPFEGDLECYPVSKDVGKVGNDSPAFIVPVASSENKSNIANFFANAKVSAKGKIEETTIKEDQAELQNREGKVTDVEGEARVTVDQSSKEDNAPVPVPKANDAESSRKRKHDEDHDRALNSPDKSTRPGMVTLSDVEVSNSGHPREPLEKPSNKKRRSATSNNNRSNTNLSKASDRSQRITDFFDK